MYQLDLIVVKEPAEEIPSHDPEPALEEWGEDHGLLHILRWKLLTGGRSPVQQLLQTEKPAVDEGLDPLMRHDALHPRGGRIQGIALHHCFASSRSGSKRH